MKTNTIDPFDIPETPVQPEINPEKQKEIAALSGYELAQIIKAASDFIDRNKWGFYSSVEDDVKQVQSCGCSGESAESAETSCCTTAPGTKVSEVLVLGPGCTKCKETYKVVERVICENNLDVKLSVQRVATSGEKKSSGILGLL